MDVRKPNPLQRALRFLAEIVVAVYIVFDAIAFAIFRPIVRFLSSLRIVHRLERFIQSLPPYVILVVMVVPFIIAELAKVFAVYWMAEGHFRSGMTIFIGAYVVSIFVCERILHAGKAQLLTIPWFAWCYNWVMAVRDAIFGWFGKTAVWRAVMALKDKTRLALRATRDKLRAAFGWRSGTEADPRAAPDCDDRATLGAMAAIDLNCDCGEGFGVYSMGDDAAMLDIVTSCNVACGFHAGDPDIMVETFASARAKGVAVGAHPGFADRAGFGRRPLPVTEAEAERLVAYQIGAAVALAALAGHRLTHVKPHGALSNLAMGDAGLAQAIARAIRAVDPSLAFLAVAGTAMERAGDATGLRTLREIYADRGYTDDGHLAPRRTPGAVLHDPAEAAARAVRMVQGGIVEALSGARVAIGIDSICVHGDTPGAVAMARAVRRSLEDAGITLAAFSHGPRAAAA